MTSEFFVLCLWMNASWALSIRMMLELNRTSLQFPMFSFWQITPIGTLFAGDHSGIDQEIDTFSPKYDSGRNEIPGMRIILFQLNNYVLPLYHYRKKGKHARPSNMYCIIHINSQTICLARSTQDIFRTKNMYSTAHPVVAPSTHPWRGQFC